jgi:Reverse transcriptase (RNA-dependent DNA polymerase)/Zinc knuckle
LWLVRFQAFAVMKKFIGAIQQMGDANLPVEETVFDTDAAKKKKEEQALKENAYAFAYLTIAITSEKLLGVIEAAKTTTFPNGLAFMVMNALKKKYMPQDTITKVELRQELMRIKMSVKEDPATLFEQLAKVKARCASAKLDSEEMIAVIIEKAPQEYQQVLTIEQRIKGAALTVDDLESAMTQHFRCVYGSRANNISKNDDGTEKEVTLVNIKGNCFKCGKPGHRAKDCRSSKSGGEKGKFKGTCHNCGMTGHAATNCWEKEENKDKRPNNWKSKKSGSYEPNIANPSIEFVMCSVDSKKEFEVPATLKLLQDPCIWIIDTAATSNSTAHREGLVNVKSASSNDNITMGNNLVSKATEIGDVSGFYCNKHGVKQFRVRLPEVTVLSDGVFNLISATAMMKRGWKLSGNESAITIHKNGVEIVFDIKISTNKGALYCAYITREPLDEVAALNSNKVIKYNIVQAHQRLGHMGEDQLRQTCTALGFELTKGPLPPCIDCAVGKARQKNIKNTGGATSDDDEAGKYYFDMASIKNDNARLPNWAILVHGKTGLKFSNFYAAKNDMVEPTLERFSKWKQCGIPVNVVRLDNAGENILLKNRAASVDWKLSIEFEFTARNTPQQNSIAETAFYTIACRGRAMLHQANIPEDRRVYFWNKCFETATKVDGLAAVTIDGITKTRYEHWFGSNPAFANHLRTWGEAGVVTLTSNMQPKLRDRGLNCMFVGYATDHAGDVYYMWNPKTNGVHVTRDIVWLKRMFYPAPARCELTSIVDPMTNIEVEEGVEVEEGANEANEADDDSEDDTVTIQTANPPRQSTRTNRGVPPTRYRDESWSVARTPSSPKRSTTAIRSFSSPNRFDALSDDDEEDTEENESDEEIAALQLAIFQAKLCQKQMNKKKKVEENFEFGLVGAGIGGGFENTTELKVMKFDEAMSGPNKEKWKKATDEEHDRMLKHKVRKIVKRRDVPKGALLLTSTWAMKQKADGTYRARMTGRGYEQIDGKHYDSDSIASPVANNITIHLLFVLMIIMLWIGYIMDVNGAFLLGNIEKGKELYMKIPQGFEKFYAEDDVWLLLKTLYGTKQAAKAFWLVLLRTIKAIGFKRSGADPCLYYKWNNGMLTVIVSWVDDLFIAGCPKEVMIVKENIKKHFECDDIGSIQEYVGNKVDIDSESIKLTQPVLIQSLKDEFEIPDGEYPNNPGVPGSVLPAVIEGEELGEKDMKTYRSGVGKLLYLVRWSRPEAWNAVRELTRFMSKASLAHLKAMYRAMKYMLGTPNRGKIFQPFGRYVEGFKFEISGRSDSDYAKCPITRKSVSGYKVCVNGAAVSAKSKMQQHVTLSVTEAELAAGVECAQDMIFTMRLIESIGLKVKLPMLLEMDNKGAVDLANNWSIGGRTRHVETRMYFLRDLKEAGIVKIQWRPTDKNDVDIFTKNADGPTFMKHLTSFVSDKVFEKVNDGSEEGVGG